MQTRTKRFYLDLLIVSFLIIISTILPQNIFAKVSAVEETIIKINDKAVNNEYIDSKKTLIFSTDGSQKLTIANYLDQDLEIGNVYFVGDEFTAPLIAKDFSIHGSTGCSTIKTGTTCSMAINARAQATPSLNPDGEHLLLHYKIAEKEGFIRFSIRSDFNDNIRFKKRNIEFKKNKAGELVGSIVINNNSTDTIQIKTIKVKKDGKVVSEIIDPEANLLLKEGESYKAELKINECDSNDILPMLVTYDIGDKKDLTAVAAAIINLDSPDQSETNIVGSALAGEINYQTIKTVYGGTVQQLTKKISIAILGNGAASKHMTTTLIGFAAGASYMIGGEVVNRGIKYDGNFWVNRLISDTSMHLLLAFSSCSVENMLYCVPISVGCGLASGYIANYITDSVYSNIVFRLPEQGWRGFFDKTRMTFNFGLMTVLRVGCKTITGTPHYGLTEIYQETLAGSAMDLIIDNMDKIHELFSKDNSDFSFLSQSENRILLNSDICAEECICTELQQSRIPSDEL